MPSTLTWRSSIDSSNADWVFGEARLISSPTTMLAKMPPGLELEVAGLLVEDRDPGDVGGQQVGGELHPADGAVDRAAERLGQHGLADPGHVLDQQVTLGEQHGQGEVDRAARLPSITDSMAVRTRPITDTTSPSE